MWLVQKAHYTKVENSMLPITLLHSQSQGIYLSTIPILAAGFATLYNIISMLTSISPSLALSLHESLHLYYVPSQDQQETPAALCKQ